MSLRPAVSKEGWPTWWVSDFLRGERTRALCSTEWRG